ncbi:MAG: thiamine phosphate synthase [Paludibacterium sp.]|uniref:thiamine phosphate synthase n=1 Tax=Paludibacterium sp. TaxID=1917523 RepID=UPI0025EF0C69|nr:thiamine phosphate synthase [Paludibacterium sp.]MBV8047624.1 thiamine phosphate synthase [Paludibacterium sp.]MBV8648012.1 thiamine phosphate synthase [Paludibacterium sp.]
MNKRHNVRGLYAITQDVDDDNHLAGQARLVLQGGASVLQYRSKSSDGRLKYRQGRLLKTLCREFGALFIVNDDLDLTIKLKADGVHLGHNDMTVRQARVALGANCIIGASCYNSLVIAHKAKQDGADYLAFGTVFPSLTKPGAVHAPLELFAQARVLERPLVAIGGIHAGNAQSVIQAGADALAVINGLFAQPDPTEAASAIARLFTI